MPPGLVHITERNVEGKRFLVNALDIHIRPSGASGIIGCRAGGDGALPGSFAFGGAECARRGRFLRSRRHPLR